MSTLRQAVILCGGLGTRLHPYTIDLPKPMIATNGRPFLAYIVDQLAAQGIERIILLTGYRGDQIEKYFGDGAQFGVAITYAQGPVEWETAKRIWEARDAYDPQFLLMYSDNYIPISLTKLQAHHDASGKPLTVSLCQKDKGNIRVGASGVIEAYDSSRTQPGLDYVEVGYMVAARDRVLAEIKDPEISFSNVLKALAAAGELAGLALKDRYQSIGDPERWIKAESYLAGKRILLLDRDGTLNVKAQKARYITEWSEFQWLPDVREGLKKLAQAGFEFALITNQAGVARGMIKQAALDDIHARMTAELAADGVNIRSVYVCPHHWDEKCACRKPAPGMLLQASRDLNLRLDRTIYVGDDPRDCETADAADCMSAFVGPPEELAQLKTRPDMVGTSLAEIVPQIIATFEAWEKRDATGTGKV